MLGLQLKDLPEVPLPAGISSEPDHGEWALQHTSSSRGVLTVTGADLWSTILMHMRSTRFYLLAGDKKDAAFTFFQDGLAMAHSRTISEPQMLHAQIQHARNFQCRVLSLVVKPGTMRPQEAMPGIPWHFSYTRKIWKPS